MRKRPGAAGCGGILMLSQVWKRSVYPRLIAPTAAVFQAAPSLQLTALIPQVSMLPDWSDRHAERYSPAWRTSCKPNAV
ncbi:hypothetical protein M3223_20085 [Paenibacillus pasadenensis]|uniref:hypothetical protein n=1 Tax=Paenibacillus pasadenensis TaxID=217090 RepID=UPI00203C4807|nr:hypothetical protein [Paenibacillus pasadenensis]MCM3749655.1 hypothetical protein [Paenibacillus pasadenensis]